MNLYEALGAPPTLSSKDMAMHIRMMPTTLLSPQQRTQYSGELLNPKTRLYNELKTLRFPPRPGEEETNSLYKSVCKKITHASGEPIPYRFFKTEFQRLLKDCGYTQNTSSAELIENTLNKAIDQITDVWRFQGYAALFLRIAENSEQSDPKNAHRAWLVALEAYQRFFAEADVKDSCAYRAQTEKQFQDKCREAWGEFLKGQLEDVYQRLKRNIKQKNADGVGACVQILQLSLAKSIAPDISASAVADSLLPYTSAIRTAPSLSTAGKMYKNCPKALLAQDEHDECKRAMLGALSKATGQLAEGNENITEIIRWANALKAKELYQRGSLLVKSDANLFFEACTEFIRSVIQNHKLDRTKEMELLVTILPADFFIAKSDGDDLKQNDMLGFGVLMCLKDLLERDVSASMKESTAKTIGGRAYRMIDESVPKGTFRDKTLGKVNRYLIIQLQNRNVSHSAFRAFIDIFPDDWPIDIPEVQNFGKLKGGVIGDPLVAQAFKLLKEANEATAGTPDQEKKLRALIDFACANPGLDLGQADMNFKELVDRVLTQAFVGSFNAYMNVDLSFDKNDPDIMANLQNAISKRSQASSVIKLCGSFLPAKTKLPAEASKKPTTDSLMEKISVKKDDAFVKRRKQYDRSRAKKTTTKPTPTPPPPPTPPTPKIKPKHTKINGLRFRGGSVAAAIQYFIWMLVLPMLGAYLILRMPIHSYDTMMMRFLLFRAELYVWAALLINGIFGLMANSKNGRVSGFGKTMRVFVWMAAVLMTLVYAPLHLWKASIFARVLVGIWALILLIVMNKQIDKNAYYPDNIITIDGIKYHGGGIAVFFKFLIMQMIVPCIVASLIFIFDWQLSPGWIFGFKLIGLAIALSILRVFFTCLAEARSVKRFAAFMAVEIYMLVLPICGWYAITYFDALPLKWWMIVLYSVYGLFFLIGTIAAARMKD